MEVCVYLTEIEEVELVSSNLFRMEVTEATELVSLGYQIWTTPTPLLRGHGGLGTEAMPNETLSCLWGPYY